MYWSNAKEFCEARNAHLVTIFDEAKDTYINSE